LIESRFRPLFVDAPLRLLYPTIQSNYAINVGSDSEKIGVENRELRVTPSQIGGSCLITRSASLLRCAWMGQRVNTKPSHRLWCEECSAKNVQDRIRLSLVSLCCRKVTSMCYRAILARSIK